MNSKTIYILYAIIFFIVITNIVYFYNNFSTSTISIAYYAFNIVILISIIIFLSLYFYVFSNYLKTLSGWTGFFTYLLFYIPCLLIDFLNYVIKEFNLTTTPVFILFLSEIVFILLYIYIPKLFNYVDNTDSITLLNGPEFITTLQTIDDAKKILSYEDPQFNKSKPYFNIGLNTITSPKILYRKNYSISMWLYLNSHPPSNISYSLEKTIFNYGNGCPKISYLYDTTYAVTDESIVKDKLLVYFTNNKDTNGKHVSGVEIKIEKQKWIQLVFNYSSDKADLFMNGSLEYSYNFNENGVFPPIYNDKDLIQYGDHDGLSGAICNVKYHKTPLSKLYIVNSYNILQKKNPPINIL
jgi:hypothetical protein